MRIIMKICPDLARLDEATPIVIETKEGIKICTEDKMCRPLIEKDYALLKGTFEEKCETLRNLKAEGKIFFSYYDPAARFILEED